MADGHDYIKRLSDFLQPISGPISAFVQPTIDLGQNLMHFTEGEIHHSIDPVLQTLLGSRGGQLMGDTLAPMIATGPAPEAGEFPRIPDLSIEGYRAPIETPALRRGTTFLGEAEPRFHGTQSPIQIMRSPASASSESNLYGPGFYTTDNLPIAQGYAGNKVGLGAPGSATYRVYPVNPEVKLLHAEEPIPETVLQKLGERYGNVDDWMRQITKRDPEHPGKNFFDPPYGDEPPQVKDFPMTLEDFMGHERYRLASRGKTGLRNKQGWEVAPTHEQITQELFDALKEEGYGGIEHTGGKITGAPAHNVKIYWNPEQDIRIRPMTPEGGNRRPMFVDGRYVGREPNDTFPPRNDLEEAMRKMREADRGVSPIAPPVPESMKAPYYTDPVSGNVVFDEPKFPGGESEIVNRMRAAGRKQWEILDALQRYRIQQAGLRGSGYRYGK